MPQDVALQIDESLWGHVHVCMKHRKTRTHVLNVKARVPVCEFKVLKNTIQGVHVI